jgi:hypothetical protein
LLHTTRNQTDRTESLYPQSLKTANAGVEWAGDARLAHTYMPPASQNTPVTRCRLQFDLRGIIPIDPIQCATTTAAAYPAPAKITADFSQSYRV